jgi:hypothetical protein
LNDASEETVLLDSILITRNDTIKIAQYRNVGYVYKNDILLATATNLLVVNQLVEITALQTLFIQGVPVFTKLSISLPGLPGVTGPTGPAGTMPAMTRETSIPSGYYQVYYNPTLGSFIYIQP